jgi:hypothetical protein
MASTNLFAASLWPVHAWRRIRVSVSRLLINLALVIIKDASHAISRHCHVEAYTWEVKVQHAHGRVLAAEDDRVLVN